MTNILGLDVGRNVAVGILLNSFPGNVRRYYNSHRKDFFKIKPVYQLQKKHILKGYKDLTYLENLSIDGIVLEPTGMWYSAIWQAWANFHGIPVYWVGHSDLAYTRGHYDFPNKSDQEDALTLAAIFFDQTWVDDFDRKKWLTFYVEGAYQLRRLYLDVLQCEKIRSALVAQNKQRLCLEFPDAAEQRTEISKKHGFSPFWGWLAGFHPFTRAANIYERGSAKRLGVPITSLTRLKASHITEIEKEITQSLTQLAELINAAEFTPYLKVFNRFRFGFDNKILLLIQCYPFSKFLIDGKQWIEWIEHEKDGQWKRKKVNHSLRQFQAYFGLSYTYKQSGDKTKKKFHGSSMCRAKLFMWATDVILPNFKNTYHHLITDPKLTTKELEKMVIPHPNINTTVGEKIAKKTLLLYRAGVKGNDVQTRLLFFVTRLLFQELFSTVT